MFHRNIAHGMHRFPDISSNRPLRSILDLSDFENDLCSDQSFHILGEDWFHNKEATLCEHLHFGSTLLLLIKIENYGKIGQT